jgi:hypothetical protein
MLVAHLRRAESVYLTIPSNLFLNHLMVSDWLIRWEAPMRDWARLRLATRSPGRVLVYQSASHSRFLLEAVETALTCSSRSPCRRYR